MGSGKSWRWTLRKGLPTDGQALLKVHQAAILAATGRGYSQAELESWAYGLRSERYAEAMETGKETFLVATEGERWLFAFCSFHEDRVIGLYVAPDRARLGVGVALLTHAESAISADGHRSIRLEAALPAVPFYRANGFEIVAEREEKTRGGLVVRVCDMARAVKPPSDRHSP
ncbi:MAG: GNAT family N-acetyltransferase [Pseudomonadota bacterium]